MTNPGIRFRKEDVAGGITRFYRIFDRNRIIGQRIENKNLSIRRSDDASSLPQILSQRGLNTDGVFIVNGSQLVVSGGKITDKVESSVMIGGNKLVVLPNSRSIIEGGLLISRMFPIPGAARSDEFSKVDLQGFRIGTRPVSFAEYSMYLADTGRAAELDNISPSRLDYSYGLYGNPEYNDVNNVSWDDASAYCRWLSQRTGRSFRLPTETEWCYAKSGRAGLDYLWDSHDPKATYADFRRMMIRNEDHLEWVSDYFKNMEELDREDLINPQGPSRTSTRTCHVARGVRYTPGADPFSGLAMTWVANIREMHSPGLRGNITFRIAETITE